MLKGKPRWIRVPLYPCSVMICFSYTDVKHAKDSYAEWFNPENIQANGYVSDAAGEQYLLVALRANLEALAPPVPSLVAHEGIHFVNGVMRVAGKPPTHTWGDDEPEAYLIEWFVEEVEKEWRRRTKGLTL